MAGGVDKKVLLLVTICVVVGIVVVLFFSPVFNKLFNVQSTSGEVVALNELGIEQGKSGNLDEAISLFKEAVELDPNYAETYNNMGFAYYMKGDYKSAEQAFKKTLEVDPNHEKARVNLNQIYLIYRKIETQVIPPVESETADK